MPLPLLGAAAISAGASLLGNALGYGSQQSTNKANMKLAQYQNEWNLAQWNRENEYNSPAAQMQRLKDAGLNPNMVYGNGSAANQAAASPRAEAPHLQAYTNFGDLGASEVVNSMLTAGQIKNLEEQNNILRIDARAKQQAIIEQSIDMSRKILENRAMREDFPTARKLVQMSLKQAHQNLANAADSGRSLQADEQLTMARVETEKLRPMLSQAEYNSLMAKLPGLIAESKITSKSAYEYEEYGIRPSDPLWARALVEGLERVGSDSTGKPTAHQTVKRWVKEKIGRIFGYNPGGSRF